MSIGFGSFKFHMHHCNQQSDSHNPARRSLLKVLACGPLMLASSSAWSASNTDSQRQLSLLNLHTEESIDSIYWSTGEYIQSELDKINNLLRDHRTGEIHVIDPGLLDLLVQLRDMMGSNREFHVISGYRSAATNRKLRAKDNGIGRKSLHMQGKAIDIRLPGTPLRELHDAARQLNLGGVGYYPKSNFIHVDTGRVRFW